VPIKLVATICILLICTVFTGFNLDNKCDINFIFKTAHQVPVFVTIMISFVAGVLLMVPFTIGKRRPPKKGPKNENSVDSESNKIEQNNSALPGDETVIS